jgi:hypothetical protein
MKSTGTMKEGTVLVLSMLSFCFMPDDEFPVHVVSGGGGQQNPAFVGQMQFFFIFIFQNQGLFEWYQINHSE